MSFVRPEARAAIWKFRELLIAVAVAVLAFLCIGAGGILGWVGFALLGIAILLLLSAIQRLRFAQGRGGPGVVKIDEGQVAYFGPLTGGMVALSELVCLRIDRSGRPSHWVLETPDDRLHIPVTAGGADALFDVFAALPGIRIDRVLQQVRTADRGQALLWQRTGAAKSTLRLD